eukprot:365122-Chlamydomonas_euryale.AAC.8
MLRTSGLGLLRAMGAVQQQQAPGCGAAAARWVSLADGLDAVAGCSAALDAPEDGGAGELFPVGPSGVVDEPPQLCAVPKRKVGLRCGHERGQQHGACAYQAGDCGPGCLMDSCPIAQNKPDMHHFLQSRMRILAVTSAALEKATGPGLLPERQRRWQCQWMANRAACDRAPVGRERPIFGRLGIADLT